MNAFAEFIDAMKATVGAGVDPRDMIAIVGKLLTGREVGRFADDLVAFDHEAGAVAMQHDPLSAQQRHLSIRRILDRDEVNERMWLVSRQARSAMMVTELVETCG